MFLLRMSFMIYGKKEIIVDRIKERDNESTYITDSNKLKPKNITCSQLKSLTILWH